MRNVLVTGAASGIGAATCARLSEAGWAVVALDRDEAGLERLGGVVPLARSLVVDLASDHPLGDDPIGTALGDAPLHGVANVAGIGPDAGDVRLIFKVNLLAPVRLLDALRPTLAEGAAVVNVASIAADLADSVFDPLLDEALTEPFLKRVEAEIPDPDFAYMYSKRGLVRHTRRLASEWAPAVRVNTVSPGLTDTPMLERSMELGWARKVIGRIPAGRLASPHEIAAVIAFLLGPDASYISGQTLCVDGGYVGARLHRR